MVHETTVNSIYKKCLLFITVQIILQNRIFANSAKKGFVKMIVGILF